MLGSNHADSKTGFQRAVEYAREVPGDFDFTLEEVERGRYRNQEVWMITLGFTKRGLSPSLSEMMGASKPREYKTFFVNAKSGEPVAMKIRELAI